MIRDKFQDMGIGFVGRVELEQVGVLGKHGILEIVGEAELPPHLEDGPKREGPGRGHGEKANQAVDGEGEGGAD